MARGLIHVNGVTYELASPVQAESLGQTADALKAGSGAWSTDVVIDGARAFVTMDRSRIWVSAAWTTEESE